MSVKDRAVSKKTSLGYILSAPVPEPISTPFPALSSSSSSGPSSIPIIPPIPTSPPFPTLTTQTPGLLSLPRSALSLIAYHLVISPPSLPSSTTIGHPSSLLPLLSTCSHLNSLLRLPANPQLYHDLYSATFDTAALDRRYAWISATLAKQSGGSKRAFDLFGDPRSWAEDYRARWEMSGRMREVGKKGTFEVGDLGKERKGAKEMILPDLWNAWFLVTENDGRNVQFLTDQCHFHKWMAVYYKERLLKDALAPGYPEETGEKALGIWCALLSGTDLIEQSSEEVDEKIFMLRPYVFACANYDITYAPWHHRRLPTCPPECRCTTAHPTAALRSKAISYERFGYTWRRAPPHFVLGAYLVFLRLLERQSQAPRTLGVYLAPSPASAPAVTPLSKPHPPVSPLHADLFNSTHIMPSIYHDREWQRNSVCQDPHSSSGLPPLTFRGELQGVWRGKFLFYQFDQYRRVLEGDMRVVYTGPFAAQEVEMELQETIVRIPKGEEGGEGSMLTAGYPAYDDEQGEGDEEGHENNEQRKIRQGYGHEVVVDPEEGDEEGWTKEILVSGRAKTEWGWARARGRVRAWDGLVTIIFNYARNQRHPMGRWLWRGYLHTGGYLIGRWRDTCTPEHLQCNEGAFGLVRAGDIFYPSEHPDHLTETLHQGDPGRHDPARVVIPDRNVSKPQSKWTLGATNSATPATPACTSASSSRPTTSTPSTALQQGSQHVHDSPQSYSTARGDADLHDRSSEGLERYSWNDTRSGAKWSGSSDGRSSERIVTPYSDSMMSGRNWGSVQSAGDRKEEGGRACMNGKRSRDEEDEGYDLSGPA